MIDAHGHLSDLRLDQLSDKLAHELMAGGVTHMIFGGIDVEEWGNQLSLEMKFPGFFSKVFGIHPWSVISHSQSQLEHKFEKLKHYANNSIAIGEIGLDFVKERKSNDSLQKQMYWLDRQLDLANDLGKPVVLHAVKGHDLIVSALNRYPNLKGIVHGWNSNSIVAKHYIERGFLLSIGPRYIQKVTSASIKWLPKSSFCIESDGPDFLKKASLNPTASEWIHHLQHISTFLAQTFEVSTDDIWALNQINLSKVLSDQK